ncbi:MAG: PAS domain S-box protein [Syntrophotaleaceae bacterium]
MSIQVPDHVLQKWQRMADLLSRMADVPVALVMRVAHPNIEVCASSSGKNNPYHAGDSELLRDSGLYCETVVRTRGRLLVPNALADPQWMGNPDIRFGLIAYLGFPVFRPDGQVFGTLCILDSKENRFSPDIEDLMLEFKDLLESHLALLSSNAEAQRAMEMARMGHWEYSVAEDLFTFNDRFYRIYGVTAEEVGGYRMSAAEYARRFVHPADRHLVAEEIRKALEMEGNYFLRRVDHRLIRGDGTVGHISVGYSRVQDDAGKTIGMHGGNQDITERKNTENELRRSQAELKRRIEEQREMETKLRRVNDLLTNLAEQVPGVIYQARLFTNGRTCFPYASPGMSDIFEVTPEEVRESAEPVFERLHPEDRDALFDAIFESARSLEIFQFEFRVLLPGQGLRWLSCRSKPMRMEDGGTLWHGMIWDITQSKIAEEKLAHSHDLMSYIIEHDRSAVAVHDKDLKYIYVSRQYLEQYGVKEQDIIGKHHYEVFPDLPQKWRDVHQRALQGEVSSAEEDPYVRQDGFIDWTRWECRPWHEADGSIGGIIVYTEVITPRKKTEEALRLMASQYATLLRTSQDGFWLVNREGRLLEVNEAYCWMVGFPREQMLGRHIRELIDGESLEEIEHRIREICEQGYSRFESRHRTADGRGIDVEISTSYWSEGERIIVFIRNITERKKYENALKKSEHRFRTFVENINDIIFSVNPKGNLTYVSPNWLHFLGEPAHEAIGRSFEHYIHTDDLKFWRNHLAQVLQGEESSGSVEYRVRHQEGHWLWHTSSGSPLRNEAGEVISWIGVARDVTEQKKMQDFMIQTEKIMSLGTMAAGMAHEINNPLSIISQGVQNVLRRTRQELPGNLTTAKECGISFEGLGLYLTRRNVFRSLEAIMAAVDRSAAIVTNMLEFSRRSDAMPIPCNLNRILEKSVQLAGTDYDLKKKYDFRNIRIETEFSLEAPVPCIPSELEQVLLNLLRNSAQSFQGVEREVPTIALRSWDDGEWAFIEVEDNGSGIEEEVRKNIFDPFFTTKKVGEGTGLGLSVSYHIIVQRHGGKISVESEAGEWTRFRICLPIPKKISR